MEQQTYQLHNGVAIPKIGFGTWKITDPEQGVQSIKDAIAAGYRLIDTAEAYGNEELVGKAVRECGLKREELFITSKASPVYLGYKNIMWIFEQTLKKTGLDYLDLYLIHWPGIPGQEELNAETWRAYEDLYRQGKVRAIGVSNFWKRSLAELLKTAEIVPMVNQIELHPGFPQTDTVELCRENNILVEAYSPLGSGKIFEQPEMIEFAEKYHKTIAQICLRWLVQKNILPLPKSVTKERIISNLRVFDFELSDEDMKKIDEMEVMGCIGDIPDLRDFWLTPRQAE